jgi:transposase
MRFLQENHAETAKWLKIIEKSSEESSMTRNRALAIRMSFKKFTVKEISIICNVSIRTIYIWFDKWEEEGFDSLIVVPGQGRKTIIEPSEYDEVFEIVDKNPIQLKSALSEIQQKLGKTISIHTLKGIIRKKKLGVVSENH